MINRYNEKEIAEYMLENGFLTDRKYLELSILSRYFFVEGFTKKEIKYKLVDFCEKFFNGFFFNNITYYNMIKRIVKNCNKYPLIQVGSIEITDSELEWISTVGNFDEKKMIFVLLCLLKINHIRGRNHFITEKVNQITKMTHFYDKMKSFSILRRLFLKDYIRPCLNGNLECKFTPIEGETKIVINDLENCGLYYTDYIKGGYYECKRCGKMSKAYKIRKKYCTSCSKYLTAERNRNRQKK